MTYSRRMPSVWGRVVPRREGESLWRKIILSKGKVVFSRNFGLVMCRSNEHVRCLTGHNMQPTSLLPLIKGFKTRLRSRQNRIADILKLVSDPAPFSPHLLIISRLLLKNNTRIPSDPSRIPSDFLTPLPRVLLIFRNSTEVGSRRIPSRIPSILQHLLSQMRILVWQTYSYYNSN